jgi:hypothetical protein
MDHPVGRWRVERQSAPIGPVHAVRRQGRDDPIAGMGWTGRAGAGVAGEELGNRTQWGNCAISGSAIREENAFRGLKSDGVHQYHQGERALDLSRDEAWDIRTELLTVMNRLRTLQERLVDRIYET